MPRAARAARHRTSRFATPPAHSRACRDRRARFGNRRHYAHRRQDARRSRDLPRLEWEGRHPRAGGQHVDGAGSQGPAKEVQDASRDHRRRPQNAGQRPVPHGESELRPPRGRIDRTGRSLPRIEHRDRSSEDLRHAGRGGGLAGGTLPGADPRSQGWHLRDDGVASQLTHRRTVPARGRPARRDPCARQYDRHNRGDDSAE